MKSLLPFLTIPFLLIACEKQETTAETGQTTASDDYPLNVCVVSGEELGSMGEPVVITHEGREVRFCCDQCLPQFKEDPEKYLSKLDAAG